MGSAHGMRRGKLVQTDEDMREYYAEVARIICASAISRRIAERACGPISEGRLISAVMSCEAGSARREIMQKIGYMHRYGVLMKNLFPDSDEWHYRLSPFAKTVVDRLKHDPSY